MRAVREIIAKFATAITTQRSMSGFMCEGCESRNLCSLPANRRQLCNETRAMRPRRH
jgi:hypothetical protein